MLLVVRISSYGCTWEVWKTLEKLEMHSAAPRAVPTLLSCSPNLPRASITRYTHAKLEPILMALLQPPNVNWKGKERLLETILVLPVQIYFWPQPRSNPWFISVHTHSILSTHSIPRLMPMIVIQCWPLYEVQWYSVIDEFHTSFLKSNNSLCL